MILLRLNTIIFASTLWALQPRAEQSPMLIQESQVSQVSQSGSKVGADPKRVAIIGKSIIRQISLAEPSLLSFYLTSPRVVQEPELLALPLPTSSTNWLELRYL